MDHILPDIVKIHSANGDISECIISYTLMRILTHMRGFSATTELFVHLA